MKMIIQDVLNLAAGLRALDGGVKLVKDGGVDKAVQLPYALSANTRFTIAKNLHAIDSIVKSYGQARNGLVTQISGGATEVPKQKLGEFEAAHNALLNQEEPVKLIKLRSDDLKLDVNDIPPTVLAMLMPMLEDAG